MIVELYGLPGSGKTTLAKKLAQQEGWECVQMRKKGDIIFYFFLGLVRHPIIFSRGAFLCASNNCSIFHIWNSYMTRYAKYQKATMSTAPYVVLDEGLLQYTLSILPQVTRKKIIQKLLSDNFVSDYTVVFDLDETVRQTQLAEREKKITPLNSVHSTERNLVIKQNHQTIKNFLHDNMNTLFIMTPEEGDTVATNVKSREV